MSLKSNDLCLPKVADDEPIFVLRAQDESAPLVIAEWLRINRTTLTPEHHDATVAALNEMCKWQLDNPTRVKKAD